jgi:glucose/arabinose dehydrogenase
MVNTLARTVAATVVGFFVAACGQPHEETSPSAAAPTVPSGFTDSQFVADISGATAMAFAPDGRLFVAEQGGRLRVVKNGVLLGTPFLTVTVDSSGERGLLGVTFDPAFASNGYVYVYYTTPTPEVHNRVSRFTASGDVAAAGSEVVLFELDNLSTATNHNGGALHFGPDGKLYVAVGDNAYGPDAQSLTSLFGKMLRLNADGSIPAANPFYGSTSGKYGAIWALGLRNPFTFAFQPGTGRMFINDVGATIYEEIDEGVAGGNYGWPLCEGPQCSGATSSFLAPIDYYAHGTGPTTGCAITGGTFYDPPSPTFPASYVGSYFFGDYCGNWIRRLDPGAGNAVSDFATRASAPVDLRVGPDGALYYLARGASAVGRIQYSTSQAPQFTSQPSSVTASAGQPASFSVSATGSSPLSYQWQRNGAAIAAATSAIYTLASTTAADSGARFRAVVTNAFGTATSSEATLTVLTDASPAAQITAPAVGSTYAAGDTIAFAGQATDPEDGTLGPSAFSWRVDFHHDAHVHPFVPETAGVTGGTFTIPTSGETSVNVWYRIHLTVKDPEGLTTSIYRDILPRVATLTLASDPTGLQVTLDGQPVATPTSVQSVVGAERVLGVVSPQVSSGVSYMFASWSDGGAETHTISTPPTASAYTARLRGGSGLRGDYYDRRNFAAFVSSRLDAMVDFDWGFGAPAAGMGIDAFSIRWTGRILPRYSETYTFYTFSDDGVRLWVDGKPVVSAWNNQTATEYSGTIPLVAGHAYDVRMEYYDQNGPAMAQLRWSSASQVKEVVPTSRLFPPAGFAP